MFTNSREELIEYERLISIRIIREDVESIYSLMQTERDPIFFNVIKLSTDAHWQSLQKTLKPGMEQSFNQIVIPGLFF